MGRDGRRGGGKRKAGVGGGKPREAKNRRYGEAKIRKFASWSGLMAQPLGWDGKRYTINILYYVPDVKSFLIFCSIDEQDWNWVRLGLELRMKAEG
jgi:hypothetical protein